MVGLEVDFCAMVEEEDGGVHVPLLARVGQRRAEAVLVHHVHWEVTQKVP
jgi:hypothetical protein